MYKKSKRKADRKNVALCIAEGFEKDFSVLCKENQKVVDAIAKGLNLDRFYVVDIK